MKILILTRLETGDEGTFGMIKVHDNEFVTGELPWRENKSNISCIPVGEYGVGWTESPKYGRKMYYVHGVLGRSGIRFHSANFMGDVKIGMYSHLLGCIAIGKCRGELEGQQAILQSRDAMKQFETLMAGEPFTLRIVDEIKGDN